MAVRKAGKRSAKDASASSKPHIRVRRAYDPPSDDDGVRILVDRLWPRGLKKESLKLDAWPKHLTPSNELRKWYHADPSRYAEFASATRRSSQRKARGSTNCGRCCAAAR